MIRILVTVATALFAATAVRAETFLYVSVAAEKRIAVYRVDGDTGKLTHRGDCPVADGEPGALTVDPARRFLFAAVRSTGKLAAFRIDAGTGKLTHLNTVPASPDPLTQTDADRVMIGEGIADLPRVIANLRSIGYRGPLSLELFNRALWSKDPAEVVRTGLERIKGLTDSGG